MINSLLENKHTTLIFIPILVLFLITMNILHFSFSPDGRFIETGEGAPGSSANISEQTGITFLAPAELIEEELSANDEAKPYL